MMICKRCNIDKPEEDFYDVDITNSRYRICRSCHREEKKAYLQSPAKFKSWVDKLKDFELVRQDPKNSELLQVRCSYCGNWFNPTNQQVNTRRKCYLGTNTVRKDGTIRTHGEGKFYCSDGCKNSCPVFKKKVYSDELNHKKLNHETPPEFRKMVFEEDNYTCIFCGKSKMEDPDLKLHCHHLRPWAKDPIQECDLDNAITVCSDCHVWIHLNVDGCRFHEICKKK